MVNSVNVRHVSTCSACGRFSIINIRSNCFDVLSDVLLVSIEDYSSRVDESHVAPVELWGTSFSKAAMGEGALLRIVDGTLSDIPADTLVLAIDSERELCAAFANIPPTRVCKSNFSDRSRLLISSCQFHSPACATYDELRPVHVTSTCCDLLSSGT